MCLECGPLLKAINSYIQKADDSLADTLEEEGIDFFLPGEKVTVYNEAGEGREYEVLAVAEMPYACGLQWFGTCDCDYFLPEGEYLDLMGEQQPMRTLFNPKVG